MAKNDFAGISNGLQLDGISLLPLIDNHPAELLENSQRVLGICSPVDYSNAIPCDRVAFIQEHWKFIGKMQYLTVPNRKKHQYSSSVKLFDLSTNIREEGKKSIKLKVAKEDENLSNLLTQAQVWIENIKNDINFRCWLKETCFPVKKVPTRR